MVTLRWLGHSCFETKNLATVVVDPHDGTSLGLPVPRSRPDAVLVSHDHDDHSGGRRLFAGRGVEFIEEPGDYQVKDVEVRGIKTYHDDAQGSRLGANSVFVFEMEGIRFCHTGDLGHPLSPDQVEELGGVDVLMVGVGGNLALAEENIKRIDPRIVVPMHYWTEGIIFPYFPLKHVEEYTRGKTNVRYIQKSEVSYKKENMPETMEIHVFSL